MAALFASKGAVAWADFRVGTFALPVAVSSAPTTGPEQCPNNGAFPNSTGWTLGAGWTISGGTLNSANASGSAVTTANVFTSGETFQVKIVVASGSGTLDLYRYPGGQLIGSISAPGTYTYTLASTGTDPIQLVSYGFTGTISSISVKQVTPGGTAYVPAVCTKAQYLSAFTGALGPRTVTANACSQLLTDNQTNANFRLPSSVETVLQGTAATIVQRGQGQNLIANARLVGGNTGTGLLTVGSTLAGIATYNGSAGLGATLGSGSLVGSYGAVLAFNGAGRAICANAGAIASDTNAPGDRSKVFISEPADGVQSYQPYAAEWIDAHVTFGSMLNNASIQAEAVPYGTYIQNNFAGSSRISGVSPTTISADFASTTIGNYTASLSPAQKGALVNGTDYTESTSYYSDIFPAKTSMAWNWPSTPAANIYGYQSIWFGNYYYGTTAPAVPFKQVSAITVLQEAFDLSYMGFVANDDIITDIFLTTAAQGVGDSGATKVTEIEIFHTCPAFAQSYINQVGVTQVGTYTDPNGMTWQVANDTGGKDILIAPSSYAPYLSGVIDIKAMFTWLVSKGVLTGNEYFGGLAIGVEPKMLGGLLVVNAFNVVYA